ncbi:MAG: hypothetical protein KBT03_03820 [Bacteroidales bacterium]|nr:hypothetical protein [Candidatus Scybalousia scybalohippi]
MKLFSIFEDANGELLEVADKQAREGITEINQTLGELEFGEIAGGKNKFDKSTKVIKAYITTSNTYGGSSDSTSFVVPIEPNKTYTVSCKGVSGTLFRVATLPSYTIPSEGQEVPCNDVIRKTAIEDITVTTSNNAKYMIVQVPTSLYTQCIGNIQIEEGETATSYEPYIPSVKMLAEKTADINSNLSVLGKCKNLLNPTLGTTTQNGVTCTANGDGTYTLNGTASTTTVFALATNLTFNGKEKIVGCPKGGSLTTYELMPVLAIGSSATGHDFGDGCIATTTTTAIQLVVRVGFVCNNIVFKPMIVDADKTPNATYDDYTIYCGNKETLTEEVANINDSLSDYGLDNKFDGLFHQGIYASNRYDSSEKGISNKNPIDCVGAKSITIKAKTGLSIRSWLTFLDASGSTVSTKDFNNVDFVCTEIHPNASKVIISLYNNNGNLSPNDVSLSVYVDNSIDEIKADLGGLAFKTETVSGTTTASGNLSVGALSINKYCIVLGARKTNAAGDYVCISPFYNDKQLGGFHITKNNGDIVANTQITVEFIYVEM